MRVPTCAWKDGECVCVCASERVHQVRILYVDRKPTCSIFTLVHTCLHSAEHKHRLTNYNPRDKLQVLMHRNLNILFISPYVHANTNTHVPAPDAHPTHMPEFAVGDADLPHPSKSPHLLDVHHRPPPSTLSSNPSTLPPHLPLFPQPLHPSSNRSTLPPPA